MTTTPSSQKSCSAGGFYNKALARWLETRILRVGNTVPPDEAFRRFRARDPDVQMRLRGFAPGAGG